MPTYIYYDPITKEEIEVSHGIKEDPEIINKKTGNKMKRKIISPFVIYKGPGWTKGIKKDGNYYVEKEKDEIRSGLKPDPYEKYRDPGEKI